MEIQAREIMRMRSAMEGILARHTGQEEEAIRRDIEQNSSSPPKRPGSTASSTRF